MPADFTKLFLIAMVGLIVAPHAGPHFMALLLDKSQRIPKSG